MYDYEKALEDKKFKIKDYILWAFAGLGLIFFLSVLFHNEKTNGDFSFVSPGFVAGKTLKEANLLQAIIILSTVLISTLIYSFVILKLEKNEKFPPALVDLIFLILCVMPFFIMFYILGLFPKSGSDAQRIAITTFLTVVVLRIRQVYQQIKINKKINQRLKKTGNKS